VAEVDLVAEYADVLQIGTRNMHNFNLLAAAGRTHKPILLKRGWSATLNEFLLAAEYILSAGNGKVILCERGIRTYEGYPKLRSYGGLVWFLVAPRPIFVKCFDYIGCLCPPISAHRGERGA